MDYTAEERFSLFNEYLGSGTVDSKIWFVGVEEGAEVNNETELERQLIACKEQQRYFEDASDKTSVWWIIAKLMHPLFSQDIAIEKFKRDMFQKQHSHFFLTELFPLPKSNTSVWPEHYKEFFGYGKEDHDSYLSVVRSTRYPIIYAKWKEVKPAITICFSSENWSEFENLFMLGHSSFESHNHRNIRYYPEERIVLSKFFNYSIKADEKESLQKWIKQCSEIELV